MARLSDDQIEQKLRELPAWTREGDSLVCEFKFEDFQASVDFVNRITPPANYTLIFWRLFGDALGNRTVNSTDQGQFQAAQGSHPGQANYRWYFDYDQSCTIDSVDYSQFLLRNGHSI